MPRISLPHTQLISKELWLKSVRRWYYPMIRVAKGFSVCNLPSYILSGKLLRWNNLQISEDLYWSFMVILSVISQSSANHFSPNENFFRLWYLKIQPDNFKSTLLLTRWLESYCYNLEFDHEVIFDRMKLIIASMQIGFNRFKLQSK